MSDSTETLAAAQRRALEAHTERAIGRAVLAAARTPRKIPAAPASTRSNRDIALEAATDEAARLVREREAARAQAKLACSDVATLRAAGEELRLAAATADRSAKAARESRDAIEAKLRDITRDRDALDHMLRDEQKNVGALHKAHSELQERAAKVEENDKANAVAYNRELSKLRQAVDAANEELNRLRLVSARPAPV